LFAAMARRLVLLGVLSACSGNAGKGAPDAARAPDALDAAVVAPDAAVDAAPDTTPPHPPLAPVVVRPAGDKTLHHLDCALNGRGEGLAAWRETDTDFKSAVWASRLPRGERAWRAAERLGARPASFIDGPVATLDDEGRGLAVWNESDVADAGVMAARLIPATGWGPPARVSTGWILSLVGSAAGDAAAFGAVEGKPPTLLRYAPASGWTPDAALRLEREGFFFASALGEGVLAWNQPAANGQELHASSYRPAVGWSAPERLQDARPFDHPLPILNGAVGPDGMSVLLWNRGGEVKGQLFAAARTAGAWQPPHLLADGDAALWTTTVAVAGAQALVVWETGDAPERKVWAARHSAGWQAAVALGEGSELTAGAVNGAGTAVVAWATPAGIFGRHYTAARGWTGTAAALDRNAGVASLCAAIDGEGRGWIVWVGKSPQVVQAAALAD
jgi:hypothetical protein